MKISGIACLRYVGFDFIDCGFFTKSCGLADWNCICVR